jgi:hypothetical protein
MLTRIMATQSASLCVRTMTPSCGTLPFDPTTVRIKPQLAFSQKPLFYGTIQAIEFVKVARPRGFEPLTF